MSFKIQDLVGRMATEIGCPPGMTCLTTQITDVQVLENTLGTQNPSIKAIREVAASIEGEPTAAQLKILEEKLREALNAVKPQLS